MNERRTRRAIAVSLVALAAEACTGTPSPTSRTPVPTGSSDVSPTCVPKAPPEGTLSVTGHAEAGALVPGSPQAMTVCRYSQLPSQRLVRSANIPAARTRHFQALLNAQKPVPRGTPFSCPIDRGNIDLILVRYGPANTIPIKVSLSGCRYVYDRFGQAYATTLAFRAALLNLVGGPTLEAP